MYVCVHIIILYKQKCKHTQTCVCGGGVYVCMRVGVMYQDHINTLAAKLHTRISSQLAEFTTTVMFTSRSLLGFQQPTNLSTTTAPHY